jgi:hypothetical protein
MNQQGASYIQKSIQFACRAENNQAIGGLVMRHRDAHLATMVNNPSARLLDVDVTAMEPTRWRWAISDKSVEVSHGYATSRETAQIEGNNALFALLSVVPPTP